MRGNNQNSTDATRGQLLRARVEARKRELEGAVAKLDADDRDLAVLQSALSQVEGLLTGDPDNIPHVIAAAMNRWLEANKHLDERHPSHRAN